MNVREMLISGGNSTQVCAFCRHWQCRLCENGEPVSIWGNCSHIKKHGEKTPCHHVCDYFDRITDGDPEE